MPPPVDSNTQKYKKQISQLKQQNKLLALKSKKQKKLSLKQLIKIDSRYQQKPKYPLQAFFLFLDDKRKEPGFRERYGPKDLQQFAKDMGRQWKTLSKQQKAPFERLHQQKRHEYEQQMRVFCSKYPDLATKRDKQRAQDKGTRAKTTETETSNDEDTGNAQLQNEVGESIGQQEEFEEQSPELNEIQQYAQNG